MSANESFYKCTKSVAAGKMDQLAYTEKAKARKQMDVLVIPDKVIADASNAQLVKKGSLCRIEATAGGFVTFGPATVAAPDANTQTAIKTSAGFIMIVATDDYIRTSAAMRIEVTEE